jgi:uncharacterized repeat protein (TIGR03806 family)
MKLRGLFSTVLAVFLPLGPLPAQTPAPVAPRVPWTSSRVHGTPDPPSPYRSEPAFPKLRFQFPTEITSVPGLDYLVVAEIAGKIYAFPNVATVETPDLLIDLRRLVYGVAFHPQFLSNGYMYVVSVLEGPQVLQVSRLVVRRDTHWHCLPESEIALFRWPGGSPDLHNGGALRFGPDGYLYIGIGDGSEGMDTHETGQDVSDVGSSILRIDVDHPSRIKRYRIPRDNPFVDLPGARPEIWAYGIRQPWKMSFDRATGDLWVGDVGQDLWESVLRVQRGGNYGWSVVEGGHPCRSDRKRGPTPILPPVAVHPHSEFQALIGGHVYRGSRLKELTGTYVYGDHGTGRIWGLRWDGSQVTWHQELATSQLRIVGFGEDAAGELYILDLQEGTIHQLVPNPSSRVNTSFPRKLSETGLFASVKDHRPAPGLIPYSVNAALWSDHALKERFLALPGDARITFDGIPNSPFVDAPAGWRFPDGTVLVKTFSLELEPGNPASRRRVETRLLHLQQLDDTEKIRYRYWRGYSYVWNDDQSDAILVEASGLDRPFAIRDPQAPDGVRQQTWHFPSRAECTMCHSNPAMFVLGVNTLQMNKDVDMGGRRVNQLKLLEELGVFTDPLPAPPDQLPRLVDYEDERQDLSQRARSYLHANCAHCHIFNGGGNSPFQLQANLSLPQTRIVDALPVHGTWNVPNARLLAPGKPECSMIYLRMTTLGSGHMPRVASSVVDAKGAQLMADWIKQMPPAETTPWKGVLWGLAGACTAGGLGLAAWRRRRS